MVNTQKIQDTLVDFTVLLRELKWWDTTLQKNGDHYIRPLEVNFISVIHPRVPNQRVTVFFIPPYPLVGKIFRLSALQSYP